MSPLPSMIPESVALGRAMLRDAWLSSFVTDLGYSKKANAVSFPVSFEG